MTNNINIILGLEIETEYNMELLAEMEIAEYHDSEDTKEYNDDFICETDSSLHSEKFDESETVEFISYPFEIKNLRKVLENFKEETYNRIALAQSISQPSAKKIFPLSKIFNFNKSTGCHIHLSFVDKSKKNVYQTWFRDDNYKFNGKAFPIKRFITYDFLNNINHRILKAVETKYKNKKFKEQYYRSYALNFRNKSLDFCDRERCFNLALRENNRIEFRSFNLNGVTSWKEFYGTIKIAISSIKSALNTEIKKSKPFSSKEGIKLNTKDLNLNNTGTQRFLPTVNMGKINQETNEEIDVNLTKEIAEKEDIDVNTEEEEFKRDYDNDYDDSEVDLNRMGRFSELRRSWLSAESLGVGVIHGEAV